MAFPNENKTSTGKDGESITRSNARKQENYEGSTYQYEFSATKWKILENISYPYLYFDPISEGFLIVYELGLQADVQPFLRGPQIQTRAQGLNLEIMENIGILQAAAVENNNEVTFSEPHDLKSGDNIVNTNIEIEGGAFAPATVIEVLSDVKIKIYPNISGMAPGNNILRFKFIERDIKTNTLSLNYSETGDASLDFSLILTKNDLSYLGTKRYTPHIFNNVRFTNKATDEIVFGGKIASIRKRLESTLKNGTMRLDISCISWKNQPSYATIREEYFAPSFNRYSEIVFDLVDRFLSREGVIPGTIIQTQEVPNLVFPINPDFGLYNIYEALDELAELSACFWYIDSEKKLHFRRTKSLTTTAYILSDKEASLFKNFRELIIEEDVYDFSNKKFFRGGQYTNQDLETINVIFSRDNTELIEDFQEKSAGSGVYGSLFENEELDDFVERTISTVEEVGGNTILNNVSTTLIAQSGDIAYTTKTGFIRLVQAGVTIVDPIIEGTGHNLEAGDKIVFFTEANNQLRTLLTKANKYIKITFVTNLNIFKPFQVIEVDLEIYGIKALFVVEEVNLRDTNGKLLESVVTLSNAIQNTSSSIPIFDDWKEYFRKLTTQDRKLL